MVLRDFRVYGDWKLTVSIHLESPVGGDADPPGLLGRLLYSHSILAGGLVEMS